MIKPSLVTWVFLCLLLSGCGTQDPKPQIPPHIAPPPQVCSLVPCRLPGRQPPGITEDVYIGFAETEKELLNCAVQVLDCIAKQNAARKSAKALMPVPIETPKE